MMTTYPDNHSKITDDTYYGIPSMNSEYCFSPLKQFCLQLSYKCHTTFTLLDNVANSFDVEEKYTIPHTKRGRYVGMYSVH